MDNGEFEEDDDDNVVDDVGYNPQHRDKNNDGYDDEDGKEDGVKDHNNEDGDRYDLLQPGKILMMT